MTNCIHIYTVLPSSFSKVELIWSLIIIQFKKLMTIETVLRLTVYLIECLVI